MRAGSLFKITLLLFIVSLFVLSCFSEEESIHEKQDRAILEARNTSQTAHEEYAKCYTLDFNYKPICSKKLAKKYITDKKDRENHRYREFFQEEAEKLGLLKLLRDNGASCSGIKDVIHLERLNQTYVIKCYEGSLYFVDFYDFKNQWFFVK